MSWFLFRKKGQVARRSGHWRLFRAGVVAASVLFSLAGAEVSISGEKPAEQPAPTAESTPIAQPAPTTESAPEVTPPPSTESIPAETSLASTENTVDETHDRMQRNILEQVVRFDNFFGNPKAESRRQTGYKLRLRNTFRVEEMQGFKYGLPSIRANIALSRISERLRLIIAGDNEPPPVSPSLPEDPGNPGFDRTSGNTTKFVSTELRYGLIDTPSTNLFLGAGVRLVLPPKAFVRSRFQYTYHLSDTSLFRFEETFFVRNPDGLGATTELALERLLDEKTLLRWASTGTAASGIQGIEWGSELSLIHELSSQSAITLLGGVYGNSSLNDTITNYRLQTRYRRNFMRKWLFFELEPEIFWPRTNEGQFSTKLALTFRLEVVFEGTVKK